MEEADALRPLTPDQLVEEARLVVRVDLRTMSGRRLDYATIRMPEDSALGSLIALGRQHEELGKTYRYLMLLEGRTVECGGKEYHNIMDYAGDLKAIPFEEGRETEYTREDLVFELILQQVVQAQEVEE